MHRISTGVTLSSGFKSLELKWAFTVWSVSNLCYFFFMAAKIIYLTEFKFDLKNDVDSTKQCVTEIGSTLFTTGAGI